MSTELEFSNMGLPEGIKMDILLYIAQNKDTYNLHIFCVTSLSYCIIYMLNVCVWLSYAYVCPINNTKYSGHAILSMKSSKKNIY